MTKALAGSIGSFAAGSELYGDLKAPAVKRMQIAVKASDKSAMAARAVGAIAGTLDVGQVISATGDVTKITPYRVPSKGAGMATAVAGAAGSKLQGMTAAMTAAKPARKPRRFAEARSDK